MTFRPEPATATEPSLLAKSEAPIRGAAQALPGALPAEPALVLPQGITQEKEVEKIRSELEQQGTDIPVVTKSKVWPKSPRVG